MTTEDKHRHDAIKSEDEENKTNKSKSKTIEELDIEFKELSSELMTILNKPTVKLKKKAIIKSEKVIPKSKEELDKEFKELANELKTILKK